MLNEIINKFYEEEISKEEFIKEISKKINNKSFIIWLSDNVEFGSIENIEDAVKEYKRSKEIDATAFFLTTGKKKIDKSKLFKRAWEIAKMFAMENGGKSREYISEALKISWAEAKR